MQCKTALKDIGINDKIIFSLKVPEKVTQAQFKDFVTRSVEMRVKKWSGKWDVSITYYWINLIFISNINYLHSEFKLFKNAFDRYLEEFQ